MRFGYLRYKRKDRKGEKDRKSRKEMGSDDITDDDNSDPVVGVDRNWFCPSEVNLIAIGWEQFFEMKVRVVFILRFDFKDGWSLRSKIEIDFSFTLRYEVPKPEAVRGIQKLLMPHRTTEELFNKIKNATSSRTKIKNSMSSNLVQNEVCNSRGQNRGKN